MKTTTTTPNSQNVSDELQSNGGVQIFEGRTRVIIDNIKCGGCGNTISKALTGLSLKNVVAEPENSSVEFDSPKDEKLVSLALETLKNHGYPLNNSEDGLRAVALKAKSFLSCAIGKMS